MSEKQEMHSNLGTPDSNEEKGRLSFYQCNRF